MGGCDIILWVKNNHTIGEGRQLHFHSEAAFGDHRGSQNKIKRKRRKKHGCH